MHPTSWEKLTARLRTQKLEDTTLGWRFINPAMESAYGVDSMPMTGDKVAQQYGISREDQDAMALRSQIRAASAIERGFYAEEIVPVIIPGKRAKPLWCVMSTPS